MHGGKETSLLDPTAQVCTGKYNNDNERDKIYVYSNYSSDSALIAVDSKHMWQRLKTLMQTPILSAIDLPPQKSRCGHQYISL